MIEKQIQHMKNIFKKYEVWYYLEGMCMFAIFFILCGIIIGVVPFLIFYYFMTIATSSESLFSAIANTALGCIIAFAYECVIYIILEL